MRPPSPMWGKLTWILRSDFDRARAGISRSYKRCTCLRKSRDTMIWRTSDEEPATTKRDSRLGHELQIASTSSGCSISRWKDILRNVMACNSSTAPTKSVWGKEWIYRPAGYRYISASGECAVKALNAVDQDSGETCSDNVSVTEVNEVKGRRACSVRTETS